MLAMIGLAMFLSGGLVATYGEIAGLFRARRILPAGVFYEG